MEEREELKSDFEQKFIKAKEKFNKDWEGLNNQNIELFDRNEELIDLVKSLDEKMNVLEQYFMKHVPDGENKLMELINGPEMNPDIQ